MIWSFILSALKGGKAKLTLASTEHKELEKMLLSILFGALIILLAYHLTAAAAITTTITTTITNYYNKKKNSY